MAPTVARVKPCFAACSVLLFGQFAGERGTEQMPVKLDLSGLKRIRQNAKELHGTRKLSYSELMPVDFIRAHSRFKDAAALFEAGGIKEQVDLGTEQFSDFIKANTDFASWGAMRGAAGIEYDKRQLFK